MSMVFDFDARWDEVAPHLCHPTVMRALDIGMIRWCRDQGTTWNPAWGPWTYSKCNYWKAKADEAFATGLWAEHMQWCADNGCPGVDDIGYTDWIAREGLDHLEEVMDPLYPQHDTPDWYRCHGASHDLAAWNCALGKLIFPDQDWLISIANEHSCAYTLSGEVYMDILWSHQDPATIARSILVREGMSYTFDEHQAIIGDIESSLTVRG